MCKKFQICGCNIFAWSFARPRYLRVEWRCDTDTDTRLAGQSVSLRVPVFIVSVVGDKKKLAVAVATAHRYNAHIETHRRRESSRERKFDCRLRTQEHSALPFCFVFGIRSDCIGIATSLCGTSTHTHTDTRWRSLLFVVFRPSHS